MNASPTLSGGPLEFETLIAAARAEAGLQDFGAPDVFEPLSILVDSLNREGHLSEAGAAGQGSTLKRALVNRLRIADALARHPEIREEEIKGPIVIVGLPRSGTTKLQRVLCSDPGLQKLPLWKIMNPAPFPNAPAGQADPRIAAAEQIVAQTNRAFPEFNAIHPMDAREPDEEVYLMLLTFISSIPMHGARTPSYKAWMVGQDCAEWYAFLKTLLQFIQWQDGSPGKPWVLKAPWHFRWMKLLFKTFPDATVVHCYRTSLETVPSMMSLFEHSRRMSTDLEHPREIGQLVMEYWGDAVQRFLKQRDELRTERRFVDVQYDDVVRDPVGVIRRIYPAANLPLTDDALKAMSAWDESNPKDKHGKHSYSLERYGYAPEDIRAVFGAYMDRFGPPGERS